jgi:hypothetical protein
MMGCGDRSSRGVAFVQCDFSATATDSLAPVGALCGNEHKTDDEWPLGRAALNHRPFVRATEQTRYRPVKYSPRLANMLQGSSAQSYSKFRSPPTADSLG